MCTTATLRVHNGRMECSQPIGVVVNNRRSECEHEEWRLCTNGNDTDFAVLPHLYEYARFCPISQTAGFTKQAILEVQDLLLRDVVFLESLFPFGDAEGSFYHLCIISPDYVQLQVGG